MSRPLGVLHSATGRGVPTIARLALFDDLYDEARFADRAAGVLDVMSTLNGFVRGWFLASPLSTVID